MRGEGKSMCFEYFLCAITLANVTSFNITVCDASCYFYSHNYENFREITFKFMDLVNNAANSQTQTQMGM